MDRIVPTRARALVSPVRCRRADTADRRAPASLRRLASIFPPCGFALVALAMPALAQTLLVSPSGPYRQIDEAIRAAPPRATIHVLAGVYRPFQVNKPLRIVGEPGAELDTSTALVISGIQAGETFVMAGFVTGFAFGAPVALTVTVKNCPGHVHLENLHLDSGLLGFPAAVTIRNAKQVSVQLCTLGGTLVNNSTVLLVNTRLYGVGSRPAIVGPPLAPGLHVLNSRVTVAGGYYYGGNNPGMFLESGQLTVTGDALTRIEAGAAGLSAIRTRNGQLFLDPKPTLVTSPGTPGVSGPIAATAANVPFMDMVVGAQQLTAAVVGPPRTITAILVSAPTPPTPFSTVDLWLGTPSAILTVGTIPASGLYTSTIGIPPLPRGLIAVGQGVVLSGGLLLLSNATVTTVD